MVELHSHPAAIPQQQMPGVPDAQCSLCSNCSRIRSSPDPRPPSSGNPHKLSPRLSSPGGPGCPGRSPSRDIGNPSIARLENENSFLRSTLVDMRTSIQALSSKNMELEGVVASLQEKISRAESREERLKQELRNLKMPAIGDPSPDDDNDDESSEHYSFTALEEGRNLSRLNRSWSNMQETKGSVRPPVAAFRRHVIDHDPFAHVDSPRRPVTSISAPRTTRSQMLQARAVLKKRSKSDVYWKTSCDFSPEFSSEVGERCAYTAGQAMGRYLTLSGQTPARTPFTSLYTYVQVRLATAAVSDHSEAVPNPTRLAAVCHCLDKAVMCLQENKEVFQLLRDELLAALYSGETTDHQPPPPPPSASSPSRPPTRSAPPTPAQPQLVSGSLDLTEALSSSAPPYARLVPYFLCARRLRKENADLKCLVEKYQYMTRTLPNASNLPEEVMQDPWFLMTKVVPRLQQSTVKTAFVAWRSTTLGLRDYRSCRAHTMVAKQTIRLLSRSFRQWTLCLTLKSQLKMEQRAAAARTLQLHEWTTKLQAHQEIILDLRTQIDTLERAALDVPTRDVDSGEKARMWKNFAKLQLCQTVEILRSILRQLPTKVQDSRRLLPQPDDALCRVALMPTEELLQRWVFTITGCYLNNLTSDLKDGGVLLEVLAKVDGSILDQPVNSMTLSRRFELIGLIVTKHRLSVNEDLTPQSLMASAEGKTHDTTLLQLLASAFVHLPSLTCKEESLVEVDARLTELSRIGDTWLNIARNHSGPTKQALDGLDLVIQLVNQSWSDTVRLVQEFQARDDAFQAAKEKMCVYLRRLSRVQKKQLHMTILDTDGLAAYNRKERESAGEPLPQGPIQMVPEQLHRRFKMPPMPRSFVAAVLTDDFKSPSMDMEAIPEPPPLTRADSMVLKASKSFRQASLASVADSVGSVVAPSPTPSVGSKSAASPKNSKKFVH